MYFKLTLVRLCTDINKTIKWYESALNAKVAIYNDDTITINIISNIFQRKIARVVRLKVGAEEFIYAEANDFDHSIQIPEANSMHFQHLAIIVNDINKTYHRLVSKVNILSTEPQMIPKSNTIAGGIKVLYLYDCNGFPLALVEYPSGKGKDKWHKDSNEIKGIDHSAIVVDSLEESTQWYEKVGFHIDVEDRRSGEAQEKLTQLKRAEVILRGFEGSLTYGVELIEYILPKNGNYLGNTRQQALIIQNPNINVKFYGLNHDPSGNLVYLI